MPTPSTESPPQAGPSGPGKDADRSNSLLWSIYLGMSWTWCIGMFLPVLLIRDYGVRAWWIFAIPNVVGAALMGWVLKNAKSSRRLLENHLHAATLFSLVTIAFHVFFFFWVVKLLLPAQML